MREIPNHAHTLVPASDTVYMIVSEEIEGTLNEGCELNLGLFVKRDKAST